jgi:hypothetical protein
MDLAGHRTLLPVPHFLVSFTLPEDLRAVARSNQKTIYNLLFRASAAALLQLAQDPRFVGGRLGMVGVLQTWPRQNRGGKTCRRKRRMNSVALTVQCLSWSVADSL